MTTGKLAVLVSAPAPRYHVSMNLSSPTRRHPLVWFVSRHPGAVEWAKHQNLVIDRWVAHLDPAEVCAEDVVIGTLPVNLAAAICDRGARYLHLSLKVPVAWRGRELSAEDLQRLDAQLQFYRIDRVTRDSPGKIS